MYYIYICTFTCLYIHIEIRDPEAFFADLKPLPGFDGEQIWEQLEVAMGWSRREETSILGPQRRTEESGRLEGCSTKAWPVLNLESSNQQESGCREGLEDHQHYRHHYHYQSLFSWTAGAKCSSASDSAGRPSQKPNNGQDERSVLNLWHKDLHDTFCVHIFWTYQFPVHGHWFLVWQTMATVGYPTTSSYHKLPGENPGSCNPSQPDLKGPPWIAGANAFPSWWRLRRRHGWHLRLLWELCFVAVQIVGTSRGNPAKLFRSGILPWISPSSNYIYIYYIEKLWTSQTGDA